MKPLKMRAALMRKELLLQERYEFLTKLSKQLSLSPEWAKDICKEVDAEFAGRRGAVPRQRFGRAAAHACENPSMGQSDTRWTSSRYSIPIAVRDLRAVEL